MMKIDKIKKGFDKILPKGLLIFTKKLYYFINLLPSKIYWYNFDLSQSSFISCEKSMMASLMVTSHVLEKGITMPGRRNGFGYERVREIIEMNTSAIKKYTENHIEIQASLKDLEQ